jgi:hypothetical protein
MFIYVFFAFSCNLVDGVPIHCYFFHVKFLCIGDLVPPLSLQQRQGGRVNLFSP